MHSLEEITWATGKAMGLKLTGTFEPCKACALEMDKKFGVSKIATPCSTGRGKMLFIDISSQSTVNMGGKKHWLLIVKYSTDYAWRYFLKNLSWML